MNAWQYAVDIAQVVVLPMLGVILWLTRKMRSNDLHHIEASLGRIEKKLDDQEQKLNDHVQWHLDGARTRSVRSYKGKKGC